MNEYSQFGIPADILAQQPEHPIIGIDMGDPGGDKSAETVMMVPQRHRGESDEAWAKRCVVVRDVK